MGSFNLAFLGTGADSPWVYALYEALSSVGKSYVATTRFDEYRSRQGKNRWRTSRTDAHGGLVDWVIPVPPAYATRMHLLSRYYLTCKFDRLYKETANSTGVQPYLILTNPAAERWSRSIPDERLIYWNFDDYRLFQSDRAAQIEAWEEVLIGRARIVLCASRTQQTRFQSWLPQYAGKIYHFPNAVRREWIPTEPSSSIKVGTVGYVGNMGERVDWQLVHDTAKFCPERRFVFVGGVEQGAGKVMPDWMKTRQRALGLPNVESIGRVPQAEVWRWYQTFELGWMPYDKQHPFNIACCPTKIFDGLAAGRPFVSTAVPECFLYPDHIPILSSASDAPEVFAWMLNTWSAKKAIKQLQFARKNDWHARAKWLINLLGVES